VAYLLKAVAAVHGRGVITAVAAALLWAAGTVAHAGLFDDDEARKAILDLRARIQASDDASRARIQTSDDAGRARLVELDKAHNQVFEQLRRSLLDLNAQLEAQRADNANLRGSQEQVARDLADLQRSVKESVKGAEDRLRPLEPQKVSIDGKDFIAEPDERRGHDQAMAALRGGDFDKAAALLTAFVQRYPGSGYADSARFWLGNALYGQKNYKDAITAFRTLVGSSPAHPRVPEAMLAIANCQIEMKDGRAARKTIDDLVKTFPASEAAVAGKERLVGLKG
jgi:tol-pal system protein YbgF